MHGFVDARPGEEFREVVGEVCVCVGETVREIDDVFGVWKPAVYVCVCMCVCMYGKQ